MFLSSNWKISLGGEGRCWVTKTEQLLWWHWGSTVNVREVLLGSQENWWGIMKQRWESPIIFPLLRMCQYTAKPQRKGGKKTQDGDLIPPTGIMEFTKAKTQRWKLWFFQSLGGKISFCSFQHHFSRSLTCLTWSIPGRSAELTMSSHHLLLTFSLRYETLFYFYTDKSCSGWQLQHWLTSPHEQYP